MKIDIYESFLEARLKLENEIEAKYGPFPSWISLKRKKENLQKFTEFLSLAGKFVEAEVWTVWNNNGYFKECRRTKDTISSHQVIFFFMYEVNEAISPQKITFCGKDFFEIQFTKVIQVTKTDCQEKKKDKSRFFYLEFFHNIDSCYKTVRFEFFVKS